MFVFGVNFPKNYISVARKSFSGINFPENNISRIRLWFKELHGTIVWEAFSWKIWFQWHEIMFSELIIRKITYQLQENLFLELISRKITYHVFVCDLENYMEQLLGSIFLENLISVAWNNVFGINFAKISGWSVVLRSLLNQGLVHTRVWRRK